MEFFYRYKKLLLVIAFVLITLLFAFLIYLMFIKPVISPPGPPTATTTPRGGLPVTGTGTPPIYDPGDPGTLPGGGDIPPAGGSDVPAPTASGGLTETTELTSRPTLGATLSGNGQDTQFYDQENGQFYKINSNGELTLLSDEIFHNVQNITWSPNKNKAILEYPDGANIIYDFDKEKQITMPKHWEDFDFSPDGKEIALKSIGLDPGNRFLAITNDTGTAVNIVESIGENADIVYPDWSPNKQIIAMYTQGIDFDRQEVFFVGKNDENFKSTIIEGRDFRPQWSPKGDKLVYSVYSEKNEMKPNLWVVNAEGEAIGSGRKSLNIETWADKCSFSGSDFYCAVPRDLPEGAGLFPELAKNTNDLLYKIDIDTGIKKLIAVPDGAYNMSSVMVTDDGYYLYFTDATTGRIHKINLK